MNTTRIRWTAKQAEAQERRNAERAEKVKRQRAEERAKKKLGPLNLTAKVDKDKRRYANGVSPKRAGHIYVIKVGELYKIGLSGNFSSRIVQLKQEYGFKKYTLIILISVPNMLVIESELHRVFRDKRVGGEWFKLDDTDIAIIREISISLSEL